MQDPPLLSICVRCRDGREPPGASLTERGGRKLAEAVARCFAASEAASLGVSLRGVHCMSQCKRPCLISLSGPGRYTYFFGDLDPEAHEQDVLTLAARYARSLNGFLERSARPRVMQGGILGRLPPVDPADDLVESLDMLLSKKDTDL